MALRVGPIGSTTSVDAPTWRDDELFSFEKYFLEEGVISGFAVSERGAGANMSVDVASGKALIEITNANLNPSKTYLVYFDSDATENIVVTAADATNPRKDRLVLRVDVSQNPDEAAENIAVIEILAGTPEGSPTAPAEPSNAITLAIIDIPASDTTIANSQITDSRTYVTSDTAVLADIAREANVLRKDRTVFADWSEKTIATGAITATNPIHTVDTEADASTDDLDTINAQVGTGELLILKPEHTDRTIVVKHATGNIRTADGVDFSMDNTDKAIALIRKGSTWYELSRGIGAPLTTNYVKTVFLGYTNSSTRGVSSTSAFTFDVNAFTIPANDLVNGVAYEFTAGIDVGWAAGVIDVYVQLGSTTLGTPMAGYTPTYGAGLTVTGVIYGTAAAGASVSVRCEQRFVMESTNQIITGAVTDTNVATNGTLLFQLGGKFGTSNAGNSMILKSLTLKKLSTTAF